MVMIFSGLGSLTRPLFNLCGGGARQENAALQRCGVKAGKQKAPENRRLS
jgi:hypothetical protein